MKCIILTIAYNAEKTIARTIESVLAQTGADWTYYLVDNGSTDATYEICCRYAQQHGNIVLCQEEKNNMWLFFEYLGHLLEERPDAEGLCTVDADDTLTPDFLRTAVPVMEKHGADLVILGTKFINAITGAVVGGHIMPCERVVLQKNLGEVFPQIHWFLRQIWCKLYRTSVLRSYGICALKQFVYGADTAMVLEFLRHVDKFVLVPVYGYHYSISPMSLSYRFEQGRYRADQFLFQDPINFLEEKTGYVSERNRKFMLEVYAHSLEDTLKVAVNADITPQQRLMEIYGSYCNPITEELFHKVNLFPGLEGLKERINVSVAACIIAAADKYTQEDIEKAASVFMKMNGEFAQMLPEECLQWMMVEAPKIVEWVALCRYEDAFAVLWEQFGKGELPCCQCTLSLGQFLSGALSLEKEYVMFSKLLIEWYMENGQLDCACKELSDWLLIYPDDLEFIGLKEKAIWLSENG